MQLALKAQFKTEPNPLVGAVLVSSAGQVLSEGYHEQAGLPHAEVLALSPYESVPEGAVLFVTLEPCNHHGQTPPCTELILQKNVRTVVVGCLDPNPLVSGKGVERLRLAGVHVITGVCETECSEINRVFNKHIVHQVPYVTIKAAVSLDGRIAMPSGESQWITGEASRARGHLLRSQHQAIAIGRQTLLSDNPRLTDRISVAPRQPIRIVYTTRGQLSQESNFIRHKQTRRIVITGSGITTAEEKRLIADGVEVLVADQERPSISWSLKMLYQSGVCSMLIEGGSDLIASFIRENAVDQLCLFLSGKIIGSPHAKSWTGDLGIERLADVPHLLISQYEYCGDDLLLTCFFPES